MKAWQVMAGSALVASVLAAGAAEAQNWTYVVCSLETHFTVRDPSGVSDQGRSPARFTYRFNRSDFDIYSGGAISWRSQCTPDEEFPSSSCTINAESVISRRSRTTPGAVARHDVIINRLTGGIVIQNITDIPSTSTSFRHESSGSCEPTTDPTAGQRRF